MLATGLLAALSCVAGPSAATAQSTPSPIRSVNDMRLRQSDEHARPYFRETQSHRGWEIRDPQFTVFADTSQADARWAAGHVQAAWQEASKLASRWTTTHKHEDFGLNALQVVITSEPLRERDAPLTTVNVVGIQMQVQINVARGEPNSQGQPTLAQQVVRLREGAAFGMLHAAGLDAFAPGWAVAGMAAAAGRTGLTESELLLAPQVDKEVRFGGQQWRFARATQDKLDYPPAEHAEAAARMAFLLTGDDGQHSPALFATLSQGELDARASAAAGVQFATFSGDAQPAPTNTAFDRLLAQWSKQYAEWKANPQAGLPIFKPNSDITPENLAAEREMVVLLKLLSRLTNAAMAKGDSRRGPKVVTFDREKGSTVTAPDRPKATSRSFASYAAQLLESGATWATLDTDGSVLLSTDRGRVERLLSPADGRYSLEYNDGKIVLVRQEKGGQVIRGWLDENPQLKSRPLAKFEIVAAKAGKPKVNESATGPRVSASTR